VSSLVPASLAWVGRTAEGRDWLGRLPDAVAAASARWSVELGEPFDDAFESLVLPGVRRDGSPVVVKIPFLGRENEHEADALLVWAGEGAIELLERDAATGAILLERAVPGVALKEAVDARRALDVLVDLLPRLWRQAAAPFRTLADEAEWWSSGLEDRWEAAGRPFERALLDVTLAALEQLPATQGELVLVHQDLHAGNVLSATREPWLVIDPKPLLAEREFSLAPIVRGPELGHSREEVVGRLDTLSAALGLDRERARRWSIAQTIAWAFGEDGSGAIETHIDVARWLVDASRA
jgi:streptomycin 6-kinase